MTARIYLATTLDALRGFVTAGSVAGHVERFAAEADDELSEYAALMDAAGASQELLAGPGRRVVLVAEVDSPAGPVPMRDVVAVHCDTEDRPDDADRADDLAWFASQEIPDLF